MWISLILSIIALGCLTELESFDCITGSSLFFFSGLLCPGRLSHLPRPVSVCFFPPLVLSSFLSPLESCPEPHVLSLAVLWLSPTIRFLTFHQRIQPSGAWVFPLLALVLVSFQVVSVVSVSSRFAETRFADRQNRVSAKRDSPKLGFRVRVRVYG